MGWFSCISAWRCQRAARWRGDAHTSPGGHGRVTTPHRLNQVVVVMVEAPEDEVRELRITKRLPDSGKGVGERLDLVEVDVHGGVELLALRSC